MHEEEKSKKGTIPAGLLRVQKNKGIYVACLLPYPFRKGLENKRKSIWKCQTQWEGELRMKLMPITKIPG